jgi:hypothetical protein
MDASPPIRVQVPATVLRWPPFCACCNGPADAQLPLNAPVTSGKKGKAPAKEWAVPYCSECLGHAARFALADRVRRRGYFACATALISGLVAVLVLWWLAVNFLEERLGSGLAKGTTLILGGGIVFLVYQFGKEVLDRARSEAARVTGRAENMYHGSCGHRYFAVNYQGGDGALHTFEIYNQKFAAAFRRLNAGHQKN